MSETKWPPGPWVTDYSDFHEAMGITSEDRQKREFVDICQVPMGYSGPIEDEQQAAVHLLTTAPDLYEALEGFLATYLDDVACGDWGRWDPEEETRVITARAALARARGEP